MTKLEYRNVAICIAGFILVSCLPAVLPPFYIRVGQLMLYFSGLAVAWGILGGYAGYKSFGHSAFIGIGAFSAGLMQPTVAGFGSVASLLVGLAAASVACAVIAALIAYPILRLRGSFFAIAMLGVAMVFSELNNNIEFFKGSEGISFADIVPSEVSPETFFFYLYLGALALVLLVSWLIKRSRLGYGLISIREDEDIARMLGVPTERYKGIALVISAVLTGCLGVIYAHSIGFITTGSVYREDTNLNLVVYSLLGGTGTLFGPVIGAAILVFITQVLLSDLLDFHMFATGLLLIVLILAAPNGVIGIFRQIAGRTSAKSRPQ